MTDNSSGFDLDAQYPGYRAQVGQIESSGNPLAVTGSNKGLYQFGPDEMRQYGISDWRDPGQQNSALNQETAHNYAVLSRVLGRPPQGNELYLAHQQGLPGAQALLTASPDQPAWMAIRRFYPSDAVAQRAIMGNIPYTHHLFGSDPNNVSTGDFHGLWAARFDRTPYTGGQYAGGAGSTGDPAGPASTPVAGAGLGQAQAMYAPPGADQMQAAYAPSAPVGATPGQPGAAPAGGVLAQEAGSLMQQPQMQAPPQMQMPANLARLRNAIAGRSGAAPGAGMPPTVAQRIAALMGRTS